MIIKTLTRKNGQGQLFRYLFRYMHDEKKKNNEHVVVTHNVFGNAVNEYIQSFKENEKLRIHKRKNNVKIHHTILSFSNKDTEHISKEVLEQTAQKFIELRGKDNMYVIVSHHDQEHIHLHCAVSATNIFGLSSRLSFKELSDLKHDLTDFQRQSFPELKHSFPQHGRKRKERDLEKIKSKRLNEKQSLQECIDTLFTSSRSQEHFIEQIKEHGHEPYYRNGRLQGLLYNGEQKHRLSTLGYDKEKLEELTQREALQELDDIRSNSPEREHTNDNPELDELDTIRESSRDEEYERELESAHTSTDTDSDDEE